MMNLKESKVKKDKIGLAFNGCVVILQLYRRFRN